MTLPRGYRTGGSDLRLPARERVSRFDAGRPASLTPSFAFGRGPSKLVPAIAVLAIAGGLLLARVSRRFAAPPPRTPYTVAAAETGVLRAAAELFRRDVGRYPTATEGWLVLVSNPGVEGWDGPYINGYKPDPWGTPYRYRVAGETVTVSSAGPDRTHGTADDIVAARPGARAETDERRP